MGKSRKLGEDEVRSKLDELPGWTLRSGKLRRELKFESFVDVGRCVLRAPEFTDRDGIRAVNLTGAISSGPNDVEGTTPEITLTLT